MTYMGDIRGIRGIRGIGGYLNKSLQTSGGLMYHASLAVCIGGGVCIVCIGVGDDTAVFVFMFI